MRQRGFDDDRRLVEDGPTRQLLGGIWFGNALKHEQFEFREDCFNLVRADNTGDGSDRLQLNFL